MAASNRKHKIALAQPASSKFVSLTYKRALKAQGCQIASKRFRDISLFYLASILCPWFPPHGVLWLLHMQASFHIPASWLEEGMKREHRVGASGLLREFLRSYHKISTLFHWSYHSMEALLVAKNTNKCLFIQAVMYPTKNQRFRGVGWECNVNSLPRVK
jgi:hypothetical protein